MSDQREETAPVAPAGVAAAPSAEIAGTAGEAEAGPETEPGSAAAAPPPQDVAGRVARLREAVAARAKALARLDKALKPLQEELVLEAPPKVSRALRSLRKLRSPGELPPAALDAEIVAEVDALIPAVEADQSARLARRRVSFGRQLSEAAGEAGLSCQVVTADPLELALPPFTLTVDLAAGKVALRYARLVLQELAPETDAILKAHQEQRESLRQGWTPEAFFQALREAYRQACFEGGQRPGERLPLVELLPRVALAFQGKPFWREPVASRFRDYSRARFAFDLGRLRRLGKLEQDGWRLSLAPATGGAARRKADVLYLEDGPGRGQYYQSVWFVSRTGGADPTQSEKGER